MIPILWQQFEVEPPPSGKGSRMLRGMGVVLAFMGVM